MSPPSMMAGCGALYQETSLQLFLSPSWFAQCAPENQLPSGLKRMKIELHVGRFRHPNMLILLHFVWLMQLPWTWMNLIHEHFHEFMSMIHDIAGPLGFIRYWMMKPCCGNVPSLWIWMTCICFWKLSIEEVRCEFGVYYRCWWWLLLDYDFRICETCTLYNLFVFFVFSKAFLWFWSSWQAFTSQVSTKELLVLMIWRQGESIWSPEPI